MLCNKWFIDVVIEPHAYTERQLTPVALVVTSYKKGKTTLKLFTFGDKATLSETDLELIIQCRSGDSSAWEKIVREYSRSVYKLAYRFTSRHESAEDLTQEVFIRIYRSLDQYDPELGDLSNWLMRLARNLIIDDYRKRRRQPADSSSSDDLDDHMHHLSGGFESPHRRIERQERSLQVHAAIEKLSPDLRECVIMRDIDEMSYQEIVDRLQIPEGTVKSRINRGRIELAKVLRRMKVSM